MKNKLLLMIGGLFLGSMSLTAQTVSTFDDVVATPEKVLNGIGGKVKGTFTSGNAQFNVGYETSYGGFWSEGWAYSNLKNDTSAGYGNLFASFANGAFDTTKNYVIAQHNAALKLAGSDSVYGAYLTNSTYAALSMLNGDQFAKKFGGSTGNDPDYFFITIKGYLNGLEKADSVVFYLADYRDVLSANDYVVKNWTWVDFSRLGEVDSLRFSLTTSDMGQFGANTPLYFCMDELTSASSVANFEDLTLAPNKAFYKPEGELKKIYTSGNARFNSTYSLTPWGDYWTEGFALSSMQGASMDSTTIGYTKMYHAITGRGVDSSYAFAVVSNQSRIELIGDAAGKQVDGMYVTNTNYAYLSMKWGDGFARMFTDTDYFSMQIIGVLNGQPTDTIVTYLAQNGTIRTNWQWVDLKPLGDVDALLITLQSSDNDPQFGMNTPGYVAIDNLTTLNRTTGLTVISNTLEAKVYPNPTADRVSVNVVENSKSVTYELYDITGKLYLSGKLNNQPWIELTSLPHGIYVLKLTNGALQHVQKIIKQ